MASTDSPAAARPTGTVTFLFTDIEGSTGRWEAQSAEMGAALAKHDDTLRTAIEAHGGWLFKHTGDGVLAAFASPNEAVLAAIDAQRLLELPVRMGLATGEADLRGDDYFGPTLNRAARIMAAGHGGQVLLANSTASMLTGVDLLDLGGRRLRDLSGAQHIFQVRADGLREQFPPLRTVDTVPGNLPAQQTSFVGREGEVSELVELVRAHRLVTLTGVGGVGKTRLAVQVAAELVPDFPDGVWFIELAPVSDPGAIPDAIATGLGLAQQPGLSVTENVAEGLAGRRLLVVFDNCEHVPDAVADVIGSVLARSNTVHTLATSREGLGLAAEHLWPVPPLGVREGIDSTAVRLFVERARAVLPAFRLNGNADVVVEICRRLDGIPLAIELAAARMVSMSPIDVHNRLSDRFRLLSGGRRGLERHQTLRHAVQWSYDLLSDEERVLLNRCSVFAGGFSLAAAVEVCGGDELDEYAVLELLDSLVRKSLVVVDHSRGSARYVLLETIRQFAEDQFAASGAGDEIRDRHARRFAAESQLNFERFAGRGQRDAEEWLKVELANLRTAYRWAVDRAELETAATIASRVALFAAWLDRLEPVEWVEGILADPRSRELRQLRWLFMSAAQCQFYGRLEDAIRYGEAALALIDDPQYDPVPHGIDYVTLSNAIAYGGDLGRGIDVAKVGAERSGDATVWLRGNVLRWLATLGRFDEAAAMADSVVAAAEASGNTGAIAEALNAYGMTFAGSDPERALAARRRALAVARSNNIRIWEAMAALELGSLETSHGDPLSALSLYDDSIDSLHQSGTTMLLAVTFASLVEVFDLLDRAGPAAVLCGAVAGDVVTPMVPRFFVVAEHLREVLGATAFDELAREGAAMERAAAVRYAHEQIQLAREELGKAP